MRGSNLPQHWAVVTHVDFAAAPHPDPLPLAKKSEGERGRRTKVCKNRNRVV